MSAKRRQEAIARFSVPVDDEIEATGMQEDGKRRRCSTSRVVMDEDFVVDDDDLSDGGFIDDSSPIKKTKGKTKGKSKGRAKAKMNDSFGDDNPKVMLISLKAVRLYT
jgi:SWI/SNF-related matrix-associated actin-dependent regulator of chromatin subfamily A3